MEDSLSSDNSIKKRRVKDNIEEDNISSDSNTKIKEEKSLIKSKKEGEKNTSFVKNIDETLISIYLEDNKKISEEQKSREEDDNKKNKTNLKKRKRK